MDTSVSNYIKYIETRNKKYLCNIVEIRDKVVEEPRWFKEDSTKMAQIDLRENDYIWDLNERNEIEEWFEKRLIEEIEEEEKHPPKPEPHPDMGYVTSDDFD